MKTVDWHQTGLIPELLYFQNGGIYTGSVNNTGKKEFRYKIQPGDGRIKAEVWYGPFCYEKSKMEDGAEFSLDENGRSRMLDWLNEKYIALIK